MRQEGSKNKRHAPKTNSIEEPYVFAALRILEQAGADYGTKYKRDGEKSKGNNCPDNLWREWLETTTYKEGITRANRETIAYGIGSYLEVK